jgi:hypothetical protein
MGSFPQRVDDQAEIPYHSPSPDAERGMDHKFVVEGGEQVHTGYRE